MSAQELSGQVDGQGAVPVRQAYRFAWCGGACDAGIVDQRIEAAHLADGTGEQSRNRLRVGDVTKLLGDLRIADRHGGQRTGVDVADVDERAFQRKGTGGRKADARSACGDQYAQAANLHIHRAFSE